MPKRNKSILLLSTKHDDNAVADDEAKKPEMNIFYNQAKGEIDCLVMLIHNYMSKRPTRQWPLCFFQNLLDVAGVASFITVNKLRNW